MKIIKPVLILGLLVALAAAFALPGCAPEEVTPTIEKIVVGHPICLSGSYAKAGEQAFGGIQAIVEWVNGVHGGVEIAGEKLPLEYKYYDCESKKEAVTSLIERLITVDNVDFIMAPYSSGLTLAGAPVAESYGVVYMDHGGASDRIFQQGYEYAVQTIGPGTKYHVGTLDMVHQIDPEAKKVALAYEDDEFSRMVLAGAKEHATELGFNVVFERTYPSGVTDLTPLLSDLKVAEPQIVLGGGHYEDGQLFAHQMADLDIDVKALSLVASATLPAFYEALGDTAEGVMGPSHWEYGVTYSSEAAQGAGLEWIGPSQDEFVQLFQDALGEEMIPDYHAAEAGAAILALVKAIEKADSVDSDEVRAALGDLEFMSFYGVWDVDETGLQVGHSMVDMQWQGGERVIIWPAEAKVGDPCYPKPTYAEIAAGEKCIPE
jgi:branched-chain amino acid transport system substrate-binding protein